MIRSGDLVHHAHEPWFDHIASFAGGLARTPVFATDQELRLAAIARGAPDHPVLLGDAGVRAALEVVRARRSGRFTRFDGNLASVATEIGRPEQMSATRLQTWAICPRSYLFGYLLDVEHVRGARAALRRSTRSTAAALIHAILEEFVGEAIAGDHPLDTWSAADRARLHLIAESHFTRAEQAGRTGRELFWRRDRARIIARARPVHRRGRRASRERSPPSRRGAAFRRSSRSTLASGHVLHLRGSVDRIDQRGDGSLEVLDYKTGGDDDYKKLSEEAAPRQRQASPALHLRARGARRVPGRTVGMGRLLVLRRRTSAIGYSVTPEVEQKVAWAIDHIVEGIAAGVFPAHPSEKPAYGWVDCWHCTPDGLSDANTRREWERKRLDPALAGYRGLVRTRTAR